MSTQIFRMTVSLDKFFHIRNEIKKKRNSPLQPMVYQQSNFNISNNRNRTQQGAALVVALYATA